MRSNFGRVLLAIAAVAVAGVLLILLQEDGGDDDRTTGTAPVGKRSDGKAAEGGPTTRKPSPPPVPTIVVRNGAPVGGIEEIDVEEGERIRFRVRSNTADELHIHGYDVTRQLQAGRTVKVEFPATIEGLFEAELHGSGEQIAELRVNP